MQKKKAPLFFLTAFLRQMFWVNLFYLLPASLPFLLPNMLASHHRVMIDGGVPYGLAMLLAGFLFWQAWRKGAGEELSFPSRLSNNLAYIFPVCCANAGIAVFEICLLSEEEWQAGHWVENFSYLGAVFGILLAVNWGSGTFISWLVRCFFSEICTKTGDKAQQAGTAQTHRLWGGFPLESLGQTIYRLSHPQTRGGKILGGFLRALGLVFLPASLGLGAAWFFLTPSFVLSRYFFPLVLVLLAYSFCLAPLGWMLWAVLKMLFKENWPEKIPPFQKSRIGLFFGWMLKANFIAVLPILSLSFFRPHLPSILSFFDLSHHSIRTLPPVFWLDFLCANIALAGTGFFVVLREKSRLPANRGGERADPGETLSCFGKFCKAIFGKKRL